jgi:putative transposase
MVFGCIIWTLFYIVLTMSLKPGWKSNRNVTYCCKYHVVWCPKYRRKVLTPEVAVRLKQLVNDVATETRSEVLEIEVMPDHVHLLCEVDPQFGISKFVRLVKGRTSHCLRAEFKPLRSRLPTLWTNSWFVATVGGAPLAIIKRYIEQQKNR